MNRFIKCALFILPVVALCGCGKEQVRETFVPEGEPIETIETIETSATPIEASVDDNAEIWEVIHASKYEIEAACNNQSLNDLLEGKTEPVKVIYGQGGEQGYIQYETEDEELITAYLDTLRNATIDEVITDPGEMGYTADANEDIIFITKEGEQILIAFDLQNKIHGNDAVYVLGNYKKLLSLNAEMRNQEPIEQFYE